MGPSGYLGAVVEDKSKQDEIRRLRARAEECRSMAREMKSNEGRQRLLEEAESLDQMADERKLYLRIDELWKPSSGTKLYLTTGDFCLSSFRTPLLLENRVWKARHRWPGVITQSLN